MLTYPKKALLSSWNLIERNPLGTIFGNTALLSFIALLNRALTIVTQMVIAGYFGTSLAADAYNAVEFMPDLFIVLIGSGLSMAFIPYYDRIRSQAGHSKSGEQQTSEHAGQQAGQEFANAFIFCSAFLFLCLTLVLFICAPLIGSILVPGADEATRAATISLFRVMVLTLAFLGPEGGLRGLFHTHKEFATPDLSRFAYNLILLATISIFGQWGSIQSAAWGMVIGAAVMIAIQTWRAVSLGILQIKWQFRHPILREILRKAPAVLVVLAWPMLMFPLDRAAASSLDSGSIAALGYATRVAMVPIGIIVLPFSTVLYPEFSTLANRQAYAQISERISSSLRMLLFIALPICVGILVGRTEIVQLLFERGQFDAAATHKTSSVLLFYIAAVPGFAAVFFLRGIYLSLEKAWGLCWILIAMWVGNLALNFALIRVWQAQGVTIATALIATITPFLLLYHLKRFHGLPIQLNSLFSAVAQMCLLCAVTALLFTQFVQLGNSYFANGSLLTSILILGSGGLLALAIYLLLAWIFKFAEIQWVLNRLPISK